MRENSGQRLLARSQLKEFYHDNFVETQVQHFLAGLREIKIPPGAKVVDIGGGCGHFARAIQNELGIPCRVIDRDETSVESAIALGVDALLGDALDPPQFGDEYVACFNLILHHLVGDSLRETEALQVGALSPWKGRSAVCFVNEYIYDSYFARFSGKLIYLITSSQFLSKIASGISRVVPSLRANTFGVGVRFRGAEEWESLFRENGWEVVRSIRGEDEHVSLARRLLLIRSCRRDSFVLVARRES